MSRLLDQLKPTRFFKIIDHCVLAIASVKVWEIKTGARVRPHVVSNVSCHVVVIMCRVFFFLAGSFIDTLVVQCPDLMKTGQVPTSSVFEGRG